MKNRAAKIVGIIAVCAIVIGGAIAAPRIYRYCAYRKQTNYHAASKSDLDYQMSQSRMPSFDFVDQNVEELLIGDHTVRVMSIQTEQGLRYLLAVQEGSGSDITYRFLAVQFDAGITYGKYSILPTAQPLPYVDMRALFLDDGYLIQILSDVPYVDTEGGPLYQAETDKIYNADGHEYRYCQIFWIEGNLSYDYELYSEDEDAYTISYSTIMNTAKEQQR